MSNKHDEKYLRIAKIWAESSYAKRLKVGAVIVKNNTIISDGYNGTPSGFENECETEAYEEYWDSGVFKVRIMLKTKPYVLHAEANAITKLAKSNNSSEGATLYTLVSPCLECAKLIIQSGIIRVVYSDEYRESEGLDLLKKAGIDVHKISV